MNILFIWTGLSQPLYEWRIRCIRRAMSIYPQANFKVITTLKEFFGFEIIDLYEVNEQLKEFNINLNNYCWFSDYARYYWLSKNSRTLYLDTDTFCLAPIPQIQGIGHDNFEAIWNGDDLKGIDEVFKQHENRKYLVSTADLLARRGKNLAKYFNHKPYWRKYLSKEFNNG